VSSAARRRIWLCAALAAPVAVLWACKASDDEAFESPDVAGPDGSTAAPDRALPPDASDAAVSLACGDAGAAPARVLLVQGIPRTSELAVVNMETGAVDGRLSFDGGYGVTSSLGTEPYLLAEESDTVTRLDAFEPWKTVASWDVHGDDAVDGGDPNANPVALVPVGCSKAYVLRFNRDKIAVIDQSQPGGGTPNTYIDLGPIKDPKDPNVIEMTSAVYVPSKRRVYVLLGNADLTRYVTTNDNTYLLCTAALKPSIVAIDVDTDKVVSLGGTAGGGGIALEGYNPPLGSPLVYDEANDRLLVLNAGCNEELGDGGVGGVIRRSVEQVSLADGHTTTLLSLNDQEFPSTLAYADSDHAALAFFFQGFLWNPREATLGAPILPGIDLVAVDGKGAFFGTRSTYVDGGPGPVEVLALPPGDAGSTLVLSGPFTKLGGYVAGIEAWPHR
jgi:hypothetical protein